MSKTGYGTDLRPDELTDRIVRLTPGIHPQGKPARLAILSRP